MNIESYVDEPLDRPCNNWPPKACHCCPTRGRSSSCAGCRKDPLQAFSVAF